MPWLAAICPIFLNSFFLRLSNCVESQIEVRDRRRGSPVKCRFETSISCGLAIWTRFELLPTTATALASLVKCW